MEEHLQELEETLSRLVNDKQYQHLKREAIEHILNQGILVIKEQGYYKEALTIAKRAGPGMGRVEPYPFDYIVGKLAGDLALDAHDGQNDNDQLIRHIIVEGMRIAITSA